MFGLKNFFDAIARLTTAVTRSAELFETANEQLAERFALDETAAPAQLDHQPTAVGNGRKKK